MHLLQNSLKPQSRGEGVIQKCSQKLKFKKIWQLYHKPGKGSTVDMPKRDGDVDRGLLVGDFDLECLGLGRIKEPKSRFSNNCESLWCTRNGFLWFTTVSSGLGRLRKLRRDGEGERSVTLEAEGEIDCRLPLCEPFVKTSSTPESWN